MTEADRQECTEFMRHVLEAKKSWCKLALELLSYCGSMKGPPDWQRLAEFAKRAQEIHQQEQA
jgi:hypothetical protein